MGIIVWELFTAVMKHEEPSTSPFTLTSPADTIKLPPAAAKLRAEYELNRNAVYTLYS